MPNGLSHDLTGFFKRIERDRQILSTWPLTVVQYGFHLLIPQLLLCFMPEIQRGKTDTAPDLMNLKIKQGREKAIKITEINTKLQ